MEEWDLISQTLSKCHVLFLGGPKMLKFIFLDSQCQFWLAKDPACSRNKRATTSRLCQITQYTYVIAWMMVPKETLQDPKNTIFSYSWGSRRNPQYRTLLWHLHSSIPCRREYLSAVCLQGGFFLRRISLLLFLILSLSYGKR